MQAFAGTGCCTRPCRVTGGNIYPSRESKSHKGIASVGWWESVESIPGDCWLLSWIVPNYAHIASPLHRACQKGNIVRWTAECQATFLDIKRKLSNAPILAFPQMRVLFSLDSDASDSGLGALLSQVQSGKERVIAYAARSLAKAERNSTSRHTSMVNIFWPRLTIVLCNG